MIRARIMTLAIALTACSVSTTDVDRVDREGLSFTSDDPCYAGRRDLIAACATHGYAATMAYRESACVASGEHAFRFTDDGSRVAAYAIDCRHAAWPTTADDFDVMCCVR